MGVSTLFSMWIWPFVRLLCLTALSRGFLLFLAEEKQIHVDRHVATIIGVVESSIQEAPEWVAWTLAGVLGLLFSGIWVFARSAWRAGFKTQPDNREKGTKLRSEGDLSQEHDRHDGSTNNDIEVSAALLYIGHHSAWARWLDAQHRANAGEPLSENVKIGRAAFVFERKAEEGAFVAFGRRYGALKYERIPAHLWKMSHLDLERDETTLWRATMKPRHGLEQKAVERVPAFLSLQVSEERIKELWPTVDHQLDRETALLLEKADRKEGK